MRTTLQTEYAVLSDAGPRHNNEDSYAVNSERGIYVICDGMGGHAAGERASQLAANSIVEHYGENGRSATLSEDPVAQIEEMIRVVREANRTIFNEAMNDLAVNGMGSTVVCASIHGELLTVAHVGDSRAYLIRERQVYRLTRDHSYVMDQVENGLMNEEEARLSEFSNYLTRALGPFEDMEPDTYQTTIKPDDLIVLGTDGLCKPVLDDEMAEIALRDSSLEDRCRMLIEAAARNGGTDNVTVLIIHAQPTRWYSTLLSH
ncbi:MAG TPA: protein phosphatase 2C domain-containing protein [Candidatus Koribacter sp.]|jgi:protein phosphatase